MAANTKSLDLEVGSSQFASVADDTALSITGDMTIACWVNFESLVDCEFVSKFLDTSDVRSYRFGFNETTTDQLIFSYSTDGTFQAANSVGVDWDAPDLATWYHVAVTFDASAADVKFYVNTVLQGAKQDGSGTSVYDGNSALFVGALDFSGGTTNFFDGLIDEVQIYDSIKTISDIWKSDVSGETNIQGYWKLNDVYTDSSGNGNTLVASGTPVFSATVPFDIYKEISNKSYFYFM